MSKSLADKMVSRRLTRAEVLELKVWHESDAALDPTAKRLMGGSDAHDWASSVLKTFAKGHSTFEKSAVVVRFRGEIDERMWDITGEITEQELAPDGLEWDTHITVFWGLDTDKIEDVAPIMRVDPIQATLGKTAIFESDEHDVLYIEVDSPDLVSLNSKLAELPNSNEREYIPHVTIAYLKKGEGQKYVGLDMFEGMGIIFNSITFQASNGDVTEMTLNKNKRSKIATKGPELFRDWVKQNDESIDGAWMMDMQILVSIPSSDDAQETIEGMIVELQDLLGEEYGVQVSTETEPPADEEWEKVKAHNDDEEYKSTPYRKWLEKVGIVVEPGKPSPFTEKMLDLNGITFDDKKLSKAIFKVDAADNIRDDEPVAPLAKLALALNEIFERQQSEVLAAINDSTEQKIQESDADKINRIIRSFDKEIEEVFQPFIESLLAEGGDGGSGRINDLTAATGDADDGEPQLEVSFDVTNPQVTRFLEEHSIRLADQVQQESADKINQVLQEGIANGDSNATISTMIRDTGRFSPAQAERIARTESANAYVQGQELSWQQSGVVIGKRWLLAPGACFVPGSQVLKVTPHGNVSIAIEDLQPGDSVIGHTGKTCRVLGLKPTQYDGDIITGPGFAVTPEHEFLTSNGWRAIGEYANDALVDRVLDFVIGKAKYVPAIFEKVRSLPLILRRHFGHRVPVLAIAENYQIPILNVEVNDPSVAHRNLFFERDIASGESIGHQDLDVGSVGLDTVVVDPRALPRATVGFAPAGSCNPAGIFKKFFTACRAYTWDLGFEIGIVRPAHPAIGSLESVSTKSRAALIINPAIVSIRSAKNTPALDTVLGTPSRWIGTTPRLPSTFTAAIFRATLGVFRKYLLGLSAKDAIDNQHSQIIPKLRRIRSGYRGIVYDIQVEHDESFTLACGLIAHNCPICQALAAIFNSKPNGIPLGEPALTVGDSFTATDGRKIDVSYTDINGPPGHPNCAPAGTYVQGNAVAGMRMSYSGQIREIKTRSGNTLTVTPNHPVATPSGFMTARELSKGDELFSHKRFIPSRDPSTPRFSKVSELLTPPNKQYPPMPIEKAFQTIAKSDAFFYALRRFGQEFHGDAAAGTGDIDVVSLNSQLGLSVSKQVLDHRLRFLLESSDLIASGYRNSPFMFKGISRAAAVARHSAHSLMIGTKSLRFGMTTDLDTEIIEAGGKTAAADSGLFRYLEQRLPGTVSVDEIVEIRDESFVGHVYDLQTISGVIVFDGIVVSNCRCDTEPVLDL